MTVVSSFLFFNEIPQLKVRLSELNNIVDWFVLLESTMTHSSKSKPLFYDLHKDDEGLKEFKHKIIHYVIDDTPDNYDNLKNGTDDEMYNIVVNKVNQMNHFPKNRSDYCRISWESECFIRALKDFDPLNTIVFADEADEIPKADAIKFVLNNFDPNEIYNFQGNMYYYYFNLWRKDESPWKSSTICTLEKFKNLSLCENRMKRRGYLIDNSSWHFSYLMGADSVKYKVQSHAEQSLNNPTIINNIESNIDNCLTIGRDIYFRPAQFEVVKIDESFPCYLYENQSKFSEYIKKA